MDDSGIRISLVTTCKGRLSYLRQTLPTWLDLSFEGYEVVVVDYDCPDGTQAYIGRHRRSWLATSSARDIRVVKLNRRPRFNLNDARNRGLEAARGELVLMLDSDVRIRRRNLLGKLLRLWEEGALFVSHIPVLHAAYEEAWRFTLSQFGVAPQTRMLLPLTAAIPGLSGTACFLKSGALAHGGFDVRISEGGYGFDDREFYLRYLNGFFGEALRASREDADRIAEEMVARCRLFGERDFEELANSDEERSRYYGMSRGGSLKRNRSFIVAALERIGSELASSSGRDMHLEGPARSLRGLDSPLFPGPARAACGLLLARDLYMQGRLPEALQTLEAHTGAVAASWTEKRYLLPQAWLLTARIRRLLNLDWREAYLQAIRSWSRLRGKSPQQVLEIAQAYGELGLLEGVRRWTGCLTRRADASVSQRVAGWLLLGDQLRTHKRRGWAQAYRKGLSLLEGRAQRTDADAYRIASLQQRLGAQRRARRAFERLLREGIEETFRPGVWFHLGEIARMEGRPERAREAFARCLSLNPRHRLARMALGNLEEAGHAR